jgi:5-formyltetrahydrofolate cyclo-ligase
MTKPAWRSPLLKLRAAKSPEVWQAQSQKICEHLTQWHSLQTAKVILSFISFKQEPDLSDLYQALPNKIWGFARCVDQDLVWHELKPDLQELELGKYGIWEPIASLPKIPLDQVDVILVPALACDRQGYRLGYGGGFYDRFLVNQTGIKIAVIFADSFVEKLPHDHWDIPMQALCTDNGIIEF